jgi:hypothetical protein
MSMIDDIADPQVRRLLMLDAHDFAKEAIAQQGARALANPRPDTAFHEASHAVVFSLEGVPVEYVEIWELSQFKKRRDFERTRKKAIKHGFDDPYSGVTIGDFLSQPIWLGNCHAKPGFADRFRFDPFRGIGTLNDLASTIRMSIAGFAGEAVLKASGGAADMIAMPRLSSIDERLATQALCQHFPGDPLQNWQGLVLETMLMVRENVSIVRELAAALESKNRIDSVELDPLLAKLTPKTEMEIYKRIANDNAARAEHAA